MSDPNGSGIAPSEWSFVVKGPLPRWVPYVRTRYCTYVHKDTKKWRAKVARAAKKAGVVAPAKGQEVMVTVFFTLNKKSHPDQDSLYHSLQDAISKDLLGMSDKNWAFCVYPPTFVKGRNGQKAEIVLEYK